MFVWIIYLLYIYNIFFYRPFDQKNPYLSEIVVNKELHTGESDRSCKHVEFKIDSARVRYEAGDHLGIFPTNDSAFVNKIGELLAVDLETIFKLINVDSKFVFNLGLHKDDRVKNVMFLLFTQ